jgi:hypothetical protein
MQVPTPPELLQCGIYSDIAVALKGGEWRKTSMVMLAKVFAGSVAVGGEDADELKGTQQMSKAVQQQLNRMPTSAHAAAVMTARGPAAASTAASSLGLITQLLGFISSKRASHERYRGSSEVSSAAAERWNCSHPRVNDTECLPCDSC